MKTTSNTKQKSPLNQRSLRCKFISLLRQNSNAHRPFRVFSDYCELLSIAFSNAVDKAQFEKREARYLQIIEKYSKEEVLRFSEMTTVLVFLCEADFYDHLGSIFMELEFGDEARGQYFTPYEISSLMTKIVLVDAKEVIQKTGYFTLYEPTCGAGGMVLAAAETVRELGVNYQQCLHVTAQDIDLLAVYMTYIQMTLYHIPGVVFHGNTLKVETWGHWVTPAHVMGGWDLRLHRKFQKTEEPAEYHESLVFPSVIDAEEVKLKSETNTGDKVSDALQVLMNERVGQLALF